MSVIPLSPGSADRRPGPGGPPAGGSIGGPHDGAGHGAGIGSASGAGSAVGSESPAAARRQSAARPAAGPPDPALAALEAIARDPRVREAEAALREASTALRWHEALRRRWREARAEAAVRGAAASAAVEGVMVPVAVLRAAVADRRLTEAVGHDPSLDAAAGLWRAGVRLTTWMADLQGPMRPSPPQPRALLAALHRDVVGPLAAAGRLPLEEVASPRPSGTAPRDRGPGPAPDGEELRARTRALLHLIDLPGAPALVRAAVVHAETACARPFTAGNAALGRLLARHLITRDGLEPTGVAVPDLAPGRAPAAYMRALSAYADGTADGVVSWVLWQAQSVLEGIEEAHGICRAVRAGTTAVGADPSPGAARGGAG